MEPKQRPSVRRARPEDSRAIARLHQETISWGLLAQLGEDVVAAFYRALTGSAHAFCLVADDGRQLWGFAAGVTDWRPLRREILRAIWWPLLRSAPLLLRGGRWRRLRETERYTHGRADAAHAEYVSFGVREDAPGRLWVGAALIYGGLDEFRRRGIRRVRGVVGKQNERAAKFFEAVGFQFVSELEIHPGERSRAVVVDLAPRAQGE